MKHLPSFSELRNIFVDEYFAEYLRVVVDVNTLQVNPTTSARLLSYLMGYATTIKLHTFFSADNLEKITSDIFRDPVLRDFIFCIRDRLAVYLNDEIELLIAYIAGYTGNLTDKTVPDDKSLIPRDIPDFVRDGFVTPREPVMDILRNNNFLITPIMMYMCYREITARQVA